jgi:hypothetical protein
LQQVASYNGLVGFIGEEVMASDEKKIEHQQTEAGDHAHVGKPITTPEDNARHERQQKLDMAKSFRLTNDKSNSFTIDMGDGSHVKDKRPVSDPENLSLSGKVGPMPDSVALPSQTSWMPDALPINWQATENQTNPAYQSVSAEKLSELVEKIKHPDEISAISEVFAKLHDAVSISVDNEGKMSVKEHVDGQPDVVVDYAQEKMIGGKTYYELQDGMQVVHQGESVSIGEKPHGTESITAAFAALNVPEKASETKDSSDSSNPAVTNTERVWYGRPEQQGRQLAQEILKGDFQAFNRDRNVEKFHFTPEELKTLRETFQRVIAEEQFNAVHVINCTPEEATQRLRNIGSAVQDGLINAEQAKGIRDKYDQLESDWRHTASDS